MADGATFRPKRTKLGQRDRCTVGVHGLAFVVGQGREEEVNNQPNRKENRDKYTLGPVSPNRVFNQTKESKKGYLNYL